MLKLFTALLGFIFISSSVALFSPSDEVIMLNSANFKSIVLDSNELVFVMFKADWCGHCRSLGPEYAKAAKALKGLVKLCAVDMEKDGSVGQPYNIKGFPTVKIFGSNKNSPSDYQAARTAQAIVDTALAQLKTLVNERLSGKSGSSSGSGGSSSGSGSGSGTSDVIELTDSNFEELVLDSEEPWLVALVAPWCGHCKNLKPEWAKAATELKGKVKLGSLDATAHPATAAKYNVRGYPTVKFFPSGRKDRSSADEYEGGRSASDIVTWALNKHSENLPAPEVVELNTQSQLDAACESKQICIISVLPNIFDCQSKCRNAYLETLKKMAEKYKRNQWAWLWTDALKQAELEGALGIGGFGYPAMAAVNARKGKYVLLRGSFGENGINEFLREVSVGRGQSASLPNSKLPAVVTTEPWDGKDGQLDLEEDIDLSDVVLDDLDAKIEL